MSSGTASPKAAEPQTPVISLSTTFRADDADVVIRAAGTHDFRVHKLILSLVSPIFKDMFTIPQPPAGSPDVLPHVDVEESEDTWDNILETIYPMPNPTIYDLDDLESLFLTAVKYEMQTVIDVHQKCFENRAFLLENPLRLYAIACACGLDDQAKYVARNAGLLEVVRISQGGNLRGLGVEKYCRLIAFLVERDNELPPILEKGWESFYSSCNCRKEGVEFYKTAKEKLKLPHAQVEEVYISALEERRGSACARCRWESGACVLLTPNIREFLERMFKKRDKVCDKFMWKE